MKMKSIVYGCKRANKYNTIIDMFHNVVKDSGDKISVVYEETKLTYNQLDLWSNQVADVIVNQLGCNKDTVAVRMRKSIEYVVTVMGILKAGCSYLPIDINLPEKRQNEMIVQAASMYIVENLTHRSVIVASVDEQSKQFTLDMFCNRVAVEIEQDDIAYVIYTSGTTGKPKGVMTKHIGIVNLVEWFDNLYQMKDKNAVLLASMGFDPSVEEMFGTLLTGGTLFIPNELIFKHTKNFRDYIVTNQINVVQLVPEVLRQFIAENEFMSCIEVLISGGDRLDDKLKDVVISKGYHIYNHYGPSEVSVDTLAIECEFEKKVCLGKIPTDNYILVLVDENGEIVDVGEKGELCIGGIGVSKGYVGDEERTEESFGLIKEFANTIFYHTRDVCWLDSEGFIYFEGRVDKQIKLRGKKVETDEIRDFIIGNYDVDNCYIMLRKVNDNDKLCMYYAGQEILDKRIVTRKLLDFFPQYMLPEIYIHINEFPKTFNGKIDEKALLEIDLFNFLSDEKNEINDEDVDAVYLSICSNVMQKLNLSVLAMDMNKISIEECGLDSLSFVQLVVQVEEELQIEFDPSMLSVEGYSSLGDICKYIYELVEKNQ